MSGTETSLNTESNLDIHVASKYPSIPYADLMFDKSLGKGDYAEVFKGIWKGKTVAIKKFTRGSDYKKVQAEADIMASVNPQSKYLVRLQGMCVEPPYYLVMEYMPKGNLNELLSSNQKIPWAMRYRIALEVSKGLSELHEMNVLHDDVSSLNIFLDNDYHAKLGDFGSAKPEVAHQNKAYDMGKLAVVFRELINQEEPLKSFLMAEPMQPIAPKQKEKIPSEALAKFQVLIEEACRPDVVNRPTACEIVERLKSLDCLLQIKEEKQKVELEKKEMQISASTSKGEEKSAITSSCKRRRVVAGSLDTSFSLPLSSSYSSLSTSSLSSSSFSAQCEDKKAIAEITEIRDFLISELGLSIEVSKRQSYLKDLAFYEKLAHQAPLIAKDREALNKILEDLQTDRAEKRIKRE